MAKALEQEPQVQIFGRDNVKKIHNAYGPFTYFLAFNHLPRRRKQIKQLLLVRRATTAKFLT
jgi:hypothetical protein